MAVRQLLVSTGIVVCVTLVAAATAPAMTLRAPAGKSSRVQLSNGKGTAILKSNAGTAYGRVGNGRITIFDPVRGKDTKVSLSNCDEVRHPKRRTTVCIGDNIGFTVQYGVWTATLKGRGINASAVARGTLRLRGVRGRFAIDGGASRRWPRVWRTYKLG
jgi:hypothetical protein